jgi:hypothetical protein
VWCLEGPFLREASILQAQGSALSRKARNLVPLSFLTMTSGAAAPRTQGKTGKHGLGAGHPAFESS